MSIFKVGPCGGDGGEPFSMDNIDKITSIDKIQVAYTVDDDIGSSYINAITIYYTIHGVKQSFTAGDPSGAKKIYEVTLQAGEYITSVKGYFGKTPDDPWNGVRALTFGTSITTYGPFGKEVGTQFEFQANNGKIIGFHGRAGKRVDALGVYIKVDDIGGSTGTGQCRNF